MRREILFHLLMSHCSWIITPCSIIWPNQTGVLAILDIIVPLEHLFQSVVQMEHLEQMHLGNRLTIVVLVKLDLFVVLVFPFLPHVQEDTIVLLEAILTVVLQAHTTLL